jgi:hypothetical protein
VFDGPYWPIASFRGSAGSLLERSGHIAFLQRMKYSADYFIAGGRAITAASYGAAIEVMAHRGRRETSKDRF